MVCVLVTLVLGKQKQVDPWGSLLASLGYLMTWKPVRNPVSKTKVSSQNPPRLTSGFHTYVHTCAHQHMEKHPTVDTSSVPGPKQTPSLLSQEAWARAGGHTWTLPGHCVVTDILTFATFPCIGQCHFPSSQMRTLKFRMGNPPTVSPASPL